MQVPSRRSAPASGQALPTRQDIPRCLGGRAEWRGPSHSAAKVRTQASSLG